MTRTVQKQRLVRVCLVVLALGLLPWLAGCDGLSSLRDVFHPEEIPQGKLGTSAVFLDVEPTDNIAISLDGALVASSAPYRARYLKAGPHELRIEADGYLPFVITLPLEKDTQVRLPVALRPVVADIAEVKK